MTYCGFVYLWMDRLTKRFYIGSHMGYENDGYVCSSRWMRAEYRKRPEDFKRRIIYRLFIDNHLALLEVECRWLGMIKLEELGVRYYNLTTNASSYRGMIKGGRHSEAVRKKIGDSQRGKIGHVKSPEEIEKRRQKMIGRKLSEEHKRAIGDGNRGKVISLEQREKQRRAKLGRKPDTATRAKLSAAQHLRVRRERELGIKRVIGQHSVQGRMNISNATRLRWQQYRAKKTGNMKDLFD